MRYCIITSGPIDPAASTRIKEDDYVICADGGVDFCLKHGIIPRSCYGDLDSVSAEGLRFLEYNNIPVNRFPIEKDWTDSEICLNTVPEGSDVILLCPISNGRIDHVIANIQLATGLRKSLNSIVLSDGITDIYPMNGKSGITIGIEEGADLAVSLAPLDFTAPAAGIRASGLYYPLEGIDVTAGKSLTFSNHPAKDAREISVSIENGRLAVIVTKNL